MSPYVHEAVAHRSKRVRFSNEPSSPSASSESALASTNAANDSATNPSDLGTSDSDSELSESSEEPSSDESSSEEEDDDEDTEMEEQEGQDGVVNLRANRGKKPVMRLGNEDLGPDIRDFLKDFLPQLKAANEELEAQKKAGTLRSLDAAPEDEGEPYIEMVGAITQCISQDTTNCFSRISDSAYWKRKTPTRTAVQIARATQKTAAKRKTYWASSWAVRRRSRTLRLLRWCRTRLYRASDPATRTRVWDRIYNMQGV